MTGKKSAKKSLLKKRNFSEHIVPLTKVDNSSSTTDASPGVNYKSLAPMVKLAWKVRENAYCPYSGFKVGAALRSKATGKIYTGCNVENAAFPTGLCAERGALCAAVAKEGPGIKFDEIVVVTGAEEPT